jgi:hypothetical protein
VYPKYTGSGCARRVPLTLLSRHLPSGFASYGSVAVTPEFHLGQAAVSRFTVALALAAIACGLTFKARRRGKR